VITALILGLILLIGAWEWSAFLGVGCRAPDLSLALAAAGAGMWRYLRARAALRLHDGIGAVLVGDRAGLDRLGAERGGPRGSSDRRRAGAAADLDGWCASMGMWGNGAQWTLFILALAFAADTGAFLPAGSFGRLHLAPRVSPNKTWEGVIGGMLLALGLGVGPRSGLGCRRRIF
jgi:CDP-diglyceride synthetase